MYASKIRHQHWDLRGGKGIGLTDATNVTLAAAYRTDATSAEEDPTASTQTLSTRMGWSARNLSISSASEVKTVTSKPRSAVLTATAAKTASMAYLCRR